MSSKDGSDTGAPDLESSLVTALGFEPTSGASDDARTMLVESDLTPELDWAPGDGELVTIAGDVHDRIDLADGVGGSSPAPSTVKADEAMTPPKGKGKGPRTFSASGSSRTGGEDNDETGAGDGAPDIESGSNGAADDGASPDRATNGDVSDTVSDDAGAVDEVQADADAASSEEVVVGDDPDVLIDGDSSGVAPITDGDDPSGIDHNGSSGPDDDVDGDNGDRRRGAHSAGEPRSSSPTSGYRRGGRFGGPVPARGSSAPSGSPLGATARTVAAATGAGNVATRRLDVEPSAAITAAKAAASSRVADADAAETPVADGSSSEPPPPVVDAPSGDAPETIVVDGLTLDVGASPASDPSPTGEIDRREIEAAAATDREARADADLDRSPVLDPVGDPPPPVIGDAVPSAPPADAPVVDGTSTVRSAAFTSGAGSGVRLPSLLEQGLVRRTRKVRARKVRRVVRHIDPWSVLTFSVLFFLCVFAALLLASVLVWNAALQAGTIENMESFIREIGDYQTYEIKGDVVFRAAMVIAGIMTLAASVLVVLLVVVFNLISDLVGGIRVTVVEEETIRVRRRRNQ